MTGDKHFGQLLILPALLIAAIHFIGAPMTMWEFDEPLFASAVTDYEPLAHHPPPPGYPLHIGLAKVFRLLIRDSFLALRALSYLATCLGFIALAFAFREVVADRLAIAGAALFYLSPSMLVHGTLPLSDATGIALLSTTLLFAARLIKSVTTRNALLFAFFAALTVGCRPQLSLAILPLLAYVLLRTRMARFMAIIMASFTAGCLVWVLPLIAAVGGIDGWIRFETQQASYFAAHDADLSRSGVSIPRLVVRFIAHPWGPKLLSLPILALAAVGAVSLARAKKGTALVFAAACGTYLAIALAIMDPADAARYALPSVLGVALLAATGLGVVIRRVPIAAVVASFAIGSFGYVWPVLAERRMRPSPPIAAAAWAMKEVPKDAVILYDLALWPHVTVLLPDFHPMRIDDGMRAHLNRDTPLYVYADGASTSPDAQTFSWRESDAYGKLTRNHYRVVSLIPLPPERRYLPKKGVFPYERTVDGLEWRWLEPVAEIELPQLATRRLRIQLGLPPTAGIDTNRIRVSAGETILQTITVRRAESVEATLELPPDASTIRFEAERSYVPAEVTASLNRDPRRLAVKLLDLEQLRSP